jgi:hypothetical protein
METLSKFTLHGILFALTFAFGFGSSRAGKPYNGLLFNAHKLIALGAVDWQFYKFIRASIHSPRQRAHGKPE